MLGHRVAVVGRGIVTSVGFGLPATWDALLLGVVGRRRLSSRHQGYVRSTFAHTIPLLSSGDRLVDLGDIAAREAMQEAGTQPDYLALGSSSAGYSRFEDWLTLDSPAHPGMRPGWASIELASRLGIAPDRVLHCSQACAASSYAIAAAADLICAGEVDVAMAGGVDVVTLPVIAGFESCRIHSDTCRPFDADRTGLILGEAAAFLVLASEKAVRAQNLRPEAYLSGVGLSCDAYDAVAPHPTGSGVSRAIEEAHVAAGNCTVDLICAHGTGTQLNDATEARAIIDHFSPAEVPPVVSYKGSLGHPQGASGACSAVLCVEVMRANTIFPNVGLRTLDPAINLEVPTVPHRTSVSAALSLASGSWGVNAALLFTAARL